MTGSLYGIETEYAFGAVSKHGKPYDRDVALTRFDNPAAAKLPPLPSANGGIFLAKVSRFYRKATAPVSAKISRELWLVSSSGYPRSAGLMRDCQSFPIDLESRAAAARVSGKRTPPLRLDCIRFDSVGLGLVSFALRARLSW